MSKRQELKALPSMVVFPDGDTMELGLLGEEERNAVLNRICSNINYRVSMHYASRLSDWKTFMDIMMT